MSTPSRFFVRLLRGSRSADDAGRAAAEARAAREAALTRGRPRPLDTAPPPRSLTTAPTTVSPLRGGTQGGGEVAATRRLRQERLAQHELAQTRQPNRPASPGTPADDLQVAQRQRQPLFNPQARSNLARTGGYAAIGLGTAVAATGIADWWTSNVTTPRADARVREFDAQTPKVDDVGVCAKIVRAPGQSTLLEDAACRAERMREYLADHTFRDVYERHFIDNPGAGPGSVGVTPITTPPPTTADKVKTFAIGALILSLAGGSTFLAWRYYKAHPEKFKKKAGSPVSNPTKPKPAANPA